MSVETEGQLYKKMRANLAEADGEHATSFEIAFTLENPQAPNYSCVQWVTKKYIIEVLDDARAELFEILKDGETRLDEIPLWAKKWFGAP